MLPKSRPRKCGRLMPRPGPDGLARDTPADVRARDDPSNSTRSEPPPAPTTATTRRSRSARCATGSTIWRRATGWRCSSPSVGLRFELAAYRQAARRPARHAVSAARRPSDPGGVRARFPTAAGWPRRWASSRPRCWRASRRRRSIRCRGGRSNRRRRRRSCIAQVDLAQLLPLPTHNEHDSGPYITAGLMIARNPRTGKQNVSIHRCQLSGPNRLGVLLLPRHTHMFFEMAEQARRSRSTPRSWSASIR